MRRTDLKASLNISLGLNLTPVKISGHNFNGFSVFVELFGKFCARCYDNAFVYFKNYPIIIYGWRFAAKFNNIYLYSILCILYAISTLNRYM